MKDNNFQKKPISSKHMVFSSAPKQLPVHFAEDVLNLELDVDSNNFNLDHITKLIELYKVKFPLKDCSGIFWVDQKQKILVFLIKNLKPPLQPKCH